MTRKYTTDSVDTLIEMFIDGTANEIYQYGRLLTRPTENGVQLIAYGNEVIAENNGGHIHLYLGHYETVSQTVNHYIEQLGSLLNDTNTRKVTDHRNMSPTLGIGARASQSAQYIDNYIGSFDHLSAVEQDAKAEVEQALYQRVKEIFA